MLLLLTASLLVHLTLVIALGRVIGTDADRHIPVAFPVDLVFPAGSTGRQLTEAAPANQVEPGKPAMVTNAEILPPVKPSAPVIQAAIEQSAVIAPATIGAGQRSPTAVTSGSERASQPAGATAAISGSGGVQAGAGVNDRPSPAKTQVRPLPVGYQTLVKKLIEANKVYPFAARRAGQTGSCLRRFVLERNGAVSRVEELSSCGYPFLDDAATRAINSVGRFPPLPEEIRGSEAAFTVTISFNLLNR